MDHFLQELGFREEVVAEGAITTEDVAFMDGDLQMFGRLAYPEGVTEAPVILHVYGHVPHQLVFSSKQIDLPKLIENFQ